VAEKLDEGTSHEVADPAGAGQDDVEQGHERKGGADGEGEHHLADGVTTSVSGQTFEPQRRQ